MADEPTKKRPGVKEQRALLNGIVVVRAVALESDTCQALERTDSKGGAELQLRLVNVSPSDMRALRLALDGPFFLLVDKTGITVQLRDAALRGKGLRDDKSRILDSLPRGVTLPDGLKWDDFTERQLRALLLLSDVTSARTRGQVAAVVGVRLAKLDTWEGNDKFLRVKRFLIERSRHRLREEFFKNVGIGLQSVDDVNRLAWSKMAGEVIGVLGRGKAGTGKAPGKDPALDSEIAVDLGDMGPDERAALVREFKVMAKMLTGKDKVLAVADGSLRAEE